jgi:serine protease Do
MKSFKCRTAMIVVLTATLFGCELVFARGGAKSPVLQAKSTAVTQNRPRVNADKKESSFDGGFADVVARTVTAVVNIASPRAFGVDDAFIEQRDAPSQGKARFLGSGVIVTPDGYVLTSHHVVEHASEIRVVLSDNRELNAKIVGTDPNTDIAVLKVDAVDLPVLKFGNSSSVHVGDLALAIGEPFGLRQTVTMGIISATGRSGLGILSYEDFIQTDAAISPGSSGGPLINVRGELIGIVAAGRRDYGGVGFAVPVDLVHSIMDQILKYGVVMRGWLGATLQPLTLATARAFGLTNDLHGALVSDVSSDGPAGRAGVLSGDIIVEIDGKPLRDDRDLSVAIGTKMPGTVVRLTAYREGREREFTITLTQEPTKEPRADRIRVFHFAGPLGLSVQTVTTEMSQSLDLPSQTRGAIVTEVESASRAAVADVREGDLIVEINRIPIRNTEDFYGAVRLSDMQPVLLLIERSGTRMFIVVE